MIPFLRRPVFLVVLCVVILLLGVGAFFSARTPLATVDINGDRYDVLVAQGFLARRSGLSGVAQEDLGAQGMLFVFSSPEVRTFWMKDMQFALDVLWVREGVVVAIDRDVRPPVSSFDDPERISSAPLETDMVLEFPAGFVDFHGIKEGMFVQQIQ